jgi:WD40 repeat protein
VELPSASLVAAGGSHGEVHVTMRRPGSKDNLWRFDAILSLFSSSAINNSITFMAQDGRVDPYIVVSTNDSAVVFYDVPTRTEKAPDHMNLAGLVQLDVPVNHSSISPDGRTLLSVGDSRKLHLHSISANSSRITLEHINTLPLPISGDSPASFASAFSPDGSKFAVASQEGLVLAFDIRSTRPIWTYNTQKRAHGRSQMYSDWTFWGFNSPNMPSWGVRTLKFSPGGPPGHRGHQTMMFAEVMSYPSW